MQKALRCLLLCIFGACADAGAVRLVAGRADTLIVNSLESVPLNARLVDAAGVMREAKHAQFRLAKGNDVELSNDGHVKCSRPGDAEIAATHGKLSTSVTVHCRPIVSFRMPRVVRLRVGDPPASLDVGAIGLEGESIEMVAGKMWVGDSRIATIVDEHVVAKARGSTTVEVDAGDCAVSVPVEVVESSPVSYDLLPHQYYAESLSMSAGELRNWRVPPGRYEISLFDASRAPNPLRLVSHQMDCAALSRTEQHYSCLARDGASVIVRHNESVGRGRESKATVLVYRSGEATNRSAGRPRLFVYPCPIVPR